MPVGVCVLETIPPIRGKLVKREYLRVSPRRKDIMPTVVVEHLQYPILPGELEVILIKGPSKIPKDSETSRYLAVDSWFNYPDLKKYYGPSNVVHVVRFVETVQHEIKMHPDKQVCLVLKADSEKSLNALLLSATYLMVQKGYTARDASRQIMHIIKELQVRHYKTEGDPMGEGEDLHLTIPHCLEALTTFTSLGLFDLHSLDVEEVLMRENPLYGDMNWVIPNKILALAGPTDDIYSIYEFVEYAKSYNITHMVRLNEEHYDADVLDHHGIRHIDMHMTDGGIPSWQQIEEFFDIAEEAWERGAMAVHCRAGLGRTGTMIATFLIRKFGVQAVEVVAFLRMMRPGSVLGMQAKYLDTIQYVLRGEPLSSDDVAKQLKVYYPTLSFEDCSSGTVTPLNLSQDQMDSCSSSMEDVRPTKMVKSQ